MTFRRYRVPWTVALQVAIVNFYLGGFGPAQPLLRIQQHTSLTIADISINWRLGLLAVIPVTIILYLMTRNVIGSEQAPDIKGHQSGSLNHKFWISWFGFIACISTEYAIAFWTAALLRDRVGSSAAISTVCIVAVGTGMGFGRWFGPHALKRFMLDRQLKAVMVIQFIGFAVLWFSHELLVSLFALFVVGLGTSMQFALTSLRLIGFSQGRPDLAIEQTSLVRGIAIARAPFVLGVFGDHLGISRAYLMVPVLIVIALIIVFAIPSKQSAS